jgi:hypothetical protein
MRIIVLLLALITSFTAAAQESTIQQVLPPQQAAWNHHHPEAFLSGYWNSPELTFFPTKKTSGWQATHARYRQTYQGEGREMAEGFRCEYRNPRPRCGFRPGRLETDQARWQDATGIVDAGVPPVSWGMEDRARPHLIRTMRQQEPRGTAVLGCPVEHPSAEQAVKAPLARPLVLISSPAPARGFLPVIRR